MTTATSIRPNKDADMLVPRAPAIGNHHQHFCKYHIRICRAGIMVKQQTQSQIIW